MTLVIAEQPIQVAAWSTMSDNFCDRSRHSEPAKRLGAERTAQVGAGPALHVMNSNERRQTAIRSSDSMTASASDSFQ